MQTSLFQSEAYVSTCRWSIKTPWLWDVGFFCSAAGVVFRKLNIEYFSHLFFLYKLHWVWHRDDSNFLLGIKGEQKGVYKKSSILYNILWTYDPNDLNWIRRLQINVSHSRWVRMMWVLSCCWNSIWAISQLFMDLQCNNFLNKYYFNLCKHFAAMKRSLNTEQIKTG